MAHKKHHTDVREIIYCYLSGFQNRLIVGSHIQSKSRNVLLFSQPQSVGQGRISLHCQLTDEIICILSR